MGREAENPFSQNIASVGVGVRWALSFLRPFPIRPQFEMYWGHRLIKVLNPENSLQDHGFHLQFGIGFSNSAIVAPCLVIGRTRITNTIHESRAASQLTWGCLLAYSVIPVTPTCVNNAVR